MAHCGDLLAAGEVLPGGGPALNNQQAVVSSVFPARRQQCPSQASETTKSSRSAFAAGDWYILHLQDGAFPATCPAGARSRRRPILLATPPCTPLGAPRCPAAAVLPSARGGRRARRLRARAGMSGCYDNGAAGVRDVNAGRRILPPPAGQ